MKDNKWIPVEKRLPKTDDDVLIVTSYNEIVMAFRCDYGNGRVEWNGRDVGWDGYVTHWMPLPEPPE